MSKGYLVRLKPRPAKPRKGQAKTPARYMFRGVRFEESKGWYRIDDLAFAKELRELTHNDREDGVRIFDVCTPSEASAIQAKERRNKVRREVEDAEVQSVSPQVRRASRRSGAVSMDDVRPEPEEPPPMIDGADLEEDDVEGDEGEELGRIDDGDIDQELDDGDDLLEQGGREPEPPKVRETAAPQTRKKAAKAATAPAKAAKKGAAKKDRSTARAEE